MNLHRLPALAAAWLAAFDAPDLQRALQAQLPGLPPPGPRAEPAALRALPARPALPRAAAAQGARA